MIRTDRIHHAEYLLERYRSSGLNVDIVHSDREDRDNIRVVNEVRKVNLMD